MNHEQLTAVILHKRPYRESSFLVDVFTRELGKTAAVCKGVRNSKNDKKSLLQPFQPLLIKLSGKRELKNLNQLEASQRMYRLQGRQLYSALYLNELLNRTLPAEVPVPDLYDHYLRSVNGLSQDQDMEVVLREFEIALLEELGYGIDFHTDWQTSDGIEADSYYTYVIEHGFQKLAMPIQSKNCFEGFVLGKIAANQWDKTSLLYAKRIMRLALSAILGSKPLKSRELFQQLEQFT